MLAALISSWLVNYYQPDLATQRAGQPIFIPHGLAILGVLTVLGAITAFGRLFDAITDPLIASLSDRCKSKDGRRIPFMRAAAVPFVLSCILTFWSPVNGESWLNALFLFLMLMLFYVPVNRLTRKFGKKKLILFAFAVFTVSFVYTAFFGSALPIPPAVQGYILCALAAPAMAIFGILPQAVVADIAECDALETGENRSGMFYAARTFAFKLGQSIAMLLVTAFATIGQETGAGYRIIAVAAAAVCVLGGALFMVYNEKRVYGKIMKG